MTHGEQVLEESQRMHDLRTTIRETYPNVDFPDPVMEPIWYGRLGRDLVPGKKAIVNTDNGEVFGIASDDYYLVYHEQVIHDVLETVNKFPEYGPPDVKIKMLQGGARMMVETVFSEVSHEIRDGDFVNPRDITHNSYDLGWKLGKQFGAFQLVCTNGLITGVVMMERKKRHYGNLNLNAYSNLLGESMEKFSLQINLWQQWAERALKVSELPAIFEALPFSPKEQEKIKGLAIDGTEKVSLLQLGEREKLTVWDVHNATTQFATHEIRSDIRRATIAGEIEQGFMRTYH